MLHFVKSYMKQNKSRKQTLESAQYGLEISFKVTLSLPPQTKSAYANRGITRQKKRLPKR